MPWTIPALLWALASGEAHAASCARIDAERDTLSPEEQRAALLLLEDALAAAGLPPGEPCTDVWTASHVRLGDALTVIVAHGEARERMSIERIEDLPAAYERLVRAIQSGAPASATADRDSVTAAEEGRRRIEADPLFYGQLGGAVLGLGDPQGGTAISGGYRHELDRLAVDIGLLQYFIPTDFDEEETMQVNLISLSVLTFTEPEADHSLYLGGGLGVGVAARGDDSRFGPHAQGVVGYELLRTTSLRVFPQLNVTVPLYRLSDEEGWLPSARLTLGAALTPGGRARSGR